MEADFLAVGWKEKEDAPTASKEDGTAETETETEVVQLMLPKSSYWSSHWDGCLCDSCSAILRSHNPKYPHVQSCGCKGCQHRFNFTLLSNTKDEIARARGHERAVSANMASINICERDGCNAMMKGRAVAVVTLVFNADMNGQGQVQRLEVCPACMEDIYNVVSTQPLTPRERAYSDPFDPNKRDVTDALSDVTDEQLAAAMLERIMKNGNVRELLSRPSDDK